MGLVAGSVAGLAATLPQTVLVTPLILRAESIEAASSGAHAAEPPLLERTALTLLANVLTGVGFGLLLAAFYGLRGGASWRSGLACGLAGFAAFFLAPSLGLPPSLPGTELAELGARQAWWLGTAIASAAGLALLFLARPAWPKVLGAALLAVPHLVGAPPPVAQSGAAPELARAFIIFSAVTAIVFWLALGVSSGWLFARLRGRAKP